MQTTALQIVSTLHVMPIILPMSHFITETGILTFDLRPQKVHSIVYVVFLELDTMTLGNFKVGLCDHTIDI